MSCFIAIDKARQDISKDLSKGFSRVFCNPDISCGMRLLLVLPVVGIIVNIVKAPHILFSCCVSSPLHELKGRVIALNAVLSPEINRIRAAQVVQNQLMDQLKQRINANNAAFRALGPRDLFDILVGIDSQKERGALAAEAAGLQKEQDAINAALDQLAADRQNIIDQLGPIQEELRKKSIKEVSHNTLSALGYILTYVALVVASVALGIITGPLAIVFGVVQLSCFFGGMASTLYNLYRVSSVTNQTRNLIFDMMYP